MSLETHTFRSLNVKKYRGRIKVFYSTTERNITDLIAEFLKLESFRGHFTEEEFYQVVFPRLIAAYHDFANHLTIELYKIEKKNNRKAS